MSRPAALILCGGRSQRMGQSKAWLPFGQQTLLARVVERLAPATSPLVVVAAPDQDLPPLPADVLIARDATAHCGPLAGLVAGLSTLPDSAELAFLTGCDAPFVSPELPGWLAARLGDAEAAVPRHEGRPQPLAALFRRTVVTSAAVELAAGRLKLLDWLATRHVRWIDDAELRILDPGLLCLTNINDPHRYAEALRRANL